MRCLHDKCVHIVLLLQVCPLQHEGLHLKGCLLFQLKQQIVKCRSFSFVENNQPFVNICNMPEKALGWNSKNRLGPLFAKPCNKIQIKKKKKYSNDFVRTSSPFLSGWQEVDTEAR